LAQFDFTEKGPKIIWFPFWLFVSSRPRQWLKNLALFGPLIFEGAFFVPEKLYLIILGFIIFSVVTSAIYIINDVIDIEKDRAHPYKKRRAIAAGKIHPFLALFASIIFLAVGLFNRTCPKCKNKPPSSAGVLEYSPSLDLSITPISASSVNHRA